MDLFDLVTRAKLIVGNISKSAVKLRRFWRIFYYTGGELVIIKLTPKQAAKCRKCEWGDRINYSFICPFALKCIREKDDASIPRLPKERDSKQ